MKLFKNLYKKYFGETKYKVRILTVDGSIDDCLLNSLKDVDILIEEINNTQYDMVIKIEKIRILPIIYNKKIIHSKLHFIHDDCTEMVMDGDWEYSYPKIENNLTNVVRGKYGN
jgi:hypothetical protein